jgi:hypothetical protein
MRPIRVMLSSRCEVRIKTQGGKTVSLSTVRKQLKRQLEDLFRVRTRPAFEVWINEVATPAPGDETSWTYCIDKAKSCDLFVAIFNGHSGWADKGDTVGICQAELEAALTQAPSKVSIIRVEPLTPRNDGPEAAIDQRFIEYVDHLDLFRGTATDAEAITSLIQETLQERVVDLTLRAALAARSAKGYVGQVLDWNLMNFQDRQGAIESTLRWALLSRPDSVQVNDGTVVIPVASGRVAVCCSGVPAGLSLATAREMLGQPFLRDHDVMRAIDRTPNLGGDREIGPVHLIGCHGGATESQARRHLGFPDAALVTMQAGIWVADPIQKIQVLFLTNCADEVSTRARLEGALHWMASSGEGTRLLARAVGRARIARAIGAESD